jgi:nucleolar protein 56
MKAFIATCLIGSFAFDSKGRLIEKRLFPKEPGLIASRLEKSKTEITPEEDEIIEALKKRGFRQISWAKHTQAGGMECAFEEDNLASRKMQSGFRDLALELKWVSSQAELNGILTKVNIELTKAKIREVKKDRIAIQAIGMLDEIDRIINVFMERLREWYGLYFPELERSVQSHEKFAELASKGRKECLKEYQDLASNSAGMDFSQEDMEQIQEIAKSIMGLFETKKGLAKYVERSMAEVMPNFSAVAGPLLGARLLAVAGSLDRLAMMPSSTIQLLGAEKALFRHLKGEGKAPKYGILFGHPLIQQAPKEQKGKVARLVAAKLSLAARLDRYSGKDQGNALRKELENNVNKQAN